MKTYSVTFSEEVPMEVTRDVWDDDSKKWVVKTYTKNQKYWTFYNLTDAKRFIKKNIDKYVGSSITKTWANGDWENLGEIKLSGNNKHFVANTRQKTSSYV